MYKVLCLGVVVSRYFSHLFDSNDKSGDLCNAVGVLHSHSTLLLPTVLIHFKSKRRVFSSEV